MSRYPYALRRLKIRIKPNTTGQTKWYYNSNQAHLLKHELIVYEFRPEDQPDFADCYRLDDSSFIHKDNAEIIEELPLK